MTRIKICGVTLARDAEAAAKLGAWAVGVIFYPKSPRFVTGARAREVLSAVPEGVLKVGVFLDSSAEVVRQVSEKVPLDLIQIQGSGAFASAAKLAPERLIHAVALETPENFQAARQVRAAYLLADRRRPQGKAQGATDWELARRLSLERPQTLLAGGLNPDNAGDAVRRVRAWGLDVSSGVESEPGVKDELKLKAFFDAVRRADAEV